MQMKKWSQQLEQSVRYAAIHNCVVGTALVLWYCSGTAKLHLKLLNCKALASHPVLFLTNECSRCRIMCIADTFYVVQNWYNATHLLPLVWYIYRNPIPLLPLLLLLCALMLSMTCSGLILCHILQAHHHSKSQGGIWKAGHKVDCTKRITLQNRMRLEGCSNSYWTAHTTHKATEYPTQNDGPDHRSGHA